ncbi:glutamine synthetase family protein [Porphyromonas pogonae]|uniref:glutamine synthetase family protein n=1 Tax=Porphyromonas pogonae TaxID=867595 RepID=UPI002E7A2E53|nr:glutamine synthetase family protein [Porphyromonas pogonae]
MNYTINPIVQFLEKTPSSFTKDDMIRYIMGNKIRMMNFRYIAGDGRLKVLNFVIHNASYLDEVLTAGERVDGSSLFSFMEAGSSDLYVIPRYSSAFMDPFAENPTISFFCSFMDKDGKPLETSPEYILKKAHDAFKEVTGGLKFYAMGELEYYVISPRETDFAAVDQKGYHEMGPFSKHIDFRTHAMRLIAECGGEIKYGHGEVGNFSTDAHNYEQNEIEFLPVNVERAVEQLLLGKWILYELGWRMGLNVTFAPKISVGKAGSGLHIHTKIVSEEGKNMYVDSAGLLTSIARKAIAGMMTMSGSLTAFGNTNPTSYLRLVPHQEAPTTICWGDRNRSALVRVPLGWAGKSDMCRIVNPKEKPCTKDYSFKQTIEFRCPDGSANLYLLLAGLVCAARHGFEMNDAEEIARSTYVDVNIHKSEFTDRLGHLDSLPASCAESALRLEKDRSIYEEYGVFSKDLIDSIETQLNSYNDAHLREQIKADPGLLARIVERYFYC